MNRLLFFLFTFSILFLGCNSKNLDDYDRIKLFLTKHNFSGNLDDFNEIIVINDKGDCIQCNNDYAKFISKKKADTKIIFIISQDGTKVDISPFLENSNKENIIFDYKDEFSLLNIIKGSGVIKLQDNQIKETFIVTPQNIQDILN